MPYKRISYPSMATNDLGLAVATTGGGVVNITNWGVSVLQGASAELYVLAPPVPGCRKTLVFQQPTASTLVVQVQLSTNTAQTVSVFGGPTTNLHVIKKAATASTVGATVPQLLGYNSTSWIITNAFPPSTAATVTNWGGAITVSSS